MKAITIEKAQFMVDTEKMQLVDRLNYRNRISQSAMEDMGDHYEFLYNPMTRSFVFTESQGVKLISIPQFVAIDAVGMRERFDLHKDTPTPKKDAGFFCDPHNIDRRISKGELPGIQLGKWRIIPDVENGVLFPALQTGGNKWSVKFIELVAVADGFVFRFDYKTGEVIPGEPQSVKLPKNNIVVQIQDELTIDPVGFARKFGFNDKHFIANYPIRYNLKGTIGDFNQELHVQRSFGIKYKRLNHFGERLKRGRNRKR